MIAPPGSAIAPPGPVSGLAGTDQTHRVLAGLLEQGLEPGSGLASRQGGRPDIRAHASEWADSGAMWLTGWPGEAPLVPPAPVLGAIRGITEVLAALAGWVGDEPWLDPAILIGGRSALTGQHRGGRASVGGSCRMVRAGDDWVAVNLARPDDVLAAAAVLGPQGRNPTPVWAELEPRFARWKGQDVVERLQELAVPATILPRGTSPEVALPWRVTTIGTTSDKAGGAIESKLGGLGYRTPVVVDLSAMWAGPLCAQLLGRVGMRVIKVESAARLDGARRANTAFYDWLHAGHESVVLDFGTNEGRQALHQLVAGADVVVESSRPRALEQLGIKARSILERHGGKTWISITGHGRDGPRASWVAFGDDAAAAAGLVAWDRTGSPVFCADAIADPISGLCAALAGLASYRRGGGHLIDVPLSAAAAFVTERPAQAEAAYLVSRGPGGSWVVNQNGFATVVRPPVPPPAGPPARRAGADTAAVVSQLGPGGRP